ncbi:hypothetical protein D0N37_23010 [Pseudoalteromonas piscicida]|nr:hypothetical protein D0N37_23010 [Pseudoalteromonas piscicida]
MTLRTFGRLRTFRPQVDQTITNASPRHLYYFNVMFSKGAITLPLAIVFPEKATSFAMLAGGIWFLPGVFCLVGFKLIKEPIATR